MTDRARIWTVICGLVGVGFGCCEIIALVTGHREASHVLTVLASIAFVGFWLGVLRIWRTDRRLLPAPVPKEWMPEAVDIFFSVDLCPAFCRDQEQILAACSAIRTRYGLEGPLIRIRDDSLLKPRSYRISINGLQVVAETLSDADELRAKLTAALEITFQRYADAIRFFAHARAHAA
jgi:hypothetical protein